MTSALVLGGGGVTGIAWELGILRGLRDVGIDLTTADIVIGTSAGSVVGAQVTSGVSLDALYDAQLRDPGGEIAAQFGPLVLLGYLGPLLLPGDETAKRRRLGRAALKARTVSADKRVSVIRSRLAATEWPDRDLRITAVDARTGEFVVFDRSGGVDLTDAVAASCAVPLVWPPVPINASAYMDGGARSATNADVASGADIVVVIAPITRSVSRTHSISAQLGRTGATRTVVLAPDAGARRAIGRNVLDPAHRPASARAGLAQAASVADEVRAVWTS
jgi:NTE family protein